MAFLVEDGTGTVAGATAYVVVATVDAYHSDRGNDAWDAEDSEKQVAIIKATDYVDRRWGSRLKGIRLLADQPLEFPRSGLRDSRGTLVEGIPTKLENAVAEYALRILVGTELAPDPEFDDSGLGIEREMLKVGPIEIDTTLTGSVGARAYPDADRLLVEYIGAGGGTMRA